MVLPDRQQLYTQGRVAFERGDYIYAAQAFAQLLQREPRNEHFLLGMASTLVKLYRFGEAMKILQKAVKLKPMMPELHCLMGNIEQTCLNDKAAIMHYERTLAIRKGYTPAIQGLIEMYRKVGRFDDAVVLVRKAVEESDTPDPHLAEALSAIAFKAKLERESIEYTERLLRGELPPMVRSKLLFSMARVLDRVGEHERAWASVEEAASLRPVHWNPEAYSRIVDQMIEFWTRERLRSLPTSGLETREPVFIVGMPRSGTSLVEQIIAAHPEGAGAGELNEMMAISARLQKDFPNTPPGFLAETGALTQESLRTEAETYLALARKIASMLGDFAGATRIVDKLPYNYQVLPMIQLLFPGATVIHTVRDPRDVCVSCYFQDFLGPIGYSYNLEHMARYYADHVRIMEHMKRELDLPILEVRYEDLVSETEPGIRRILEHIGLPFHEDCLNFHASTRAVHTASVEQVRRPIFKSSTQRWKRYNDRIAPLVEALKSAGVELPE